MGYTLTKIAAYCLALAVFAAATWLVLSGIRSFVMMEWVALTKDPTGRGIYVLLVWWFGAFKMLDAWGRGQ